MNKRNCAKPIRMWIDGRCYNIKKLNKSTTSKHQQCVQDTPKSEIQNDRLFSTKFHLPLMYYIKLERLRNPQIVTVESETDTTITYPKYGKDGFLEISGKTEEAVKEAQEQMHSFIADIRHHTSPMQFIAIPLLSPEIQKNFEVFKNKILSENHEGVEESIFQSVLKLHLTVAVFTLLDNKEKQQAIEALEECKNALLKRDESSTLLKIKINGINCMNNDLSKVNVLYAESQLTDESDSTKSLQEIVNSVSDFFYERGLAREYQDNVKLHMTLMNTKYRKKKEGSPKKRWVKRETFNATKIIEQYKDYYFGEAVFDTIHLSLMASKGEDGFYTSLASIKL